MKDVEEPLIVIKNIRLQKEDFTFYEKASTIKFSYNGIDYLKSYAEDLKDKINSMSEIELTIIGKAKINNWMGKVSPEIFFEDYDIRNPIFDF